MVNTRYQAVIPRAVRPALQRGLSCPFGAIHLLGISCSAVGFWDMLINIENLKCTMLIGQEINDTWVLEIATAFGLAMTS